MKDLRNGRMMIMEEVDNGLYKFPNSTFQKQCKFTEGVGNDQVTCNNPFSSTFSPSGSLVLNKSVTTHVI